MEYAARPSLLPTLTPRDPRQASGGCGEQATACSTPQDGRTARGSNRRIGRRGGRRAQSRLAGDDGRLGARRRPRAESWSRQSRAIKNGEPDDPWGRRAGRAPNGTWTARWTFAGSAIEHPRALYGPTRQCETNAPRQPPRELGPGRAGNPAADGLRGRRRGRPRPDRAAQVRSCSGSTPNTTNSMRGP